MNDTNKTISANIKRPTFSIFSFSTGNKISSLKHCFMDRMIIDIKNPPAIIKAKDGWVYSAIYDSRFPESIEKIEVIISFQAHTYGRFAIIRAVNDTFSKNLESKGD